MACWGFNGLGQCNPPHINGSWMYIPPNLDTRMTFAIDTSGNIYCWGTCASSSLFLAEARQRFGPVAWRRVHAGGSNICGVTDSRLGLCTPGVRLPPSMERVMWEDLQTSGAGSVCGLSLSGYGYCWRGSRVMEVPRPAKGGHLLSMRPSGNDGSFCFNMGANWMCWRVANDLQEVASPLLKQHPVWSEFTLPCGITERGQIKCDAADSSFSVPTSAEIDEQTWMQLSISSDVCCALSSQGSVLCWGDTSLKMLLIPPDLRASEVVGTNVAMGAIALDGSEIRFWSTDVIFKSEKNHLYLPGNTVVDMAISPTHVCILFSGGQLLCDGACLSGECTPPGDEFTRWKAISVYHLVSCGITEESHMCCWGNSLRLPSDTACDAKGRPLVAQDRNWTDLVVGNYEVCGVDGTSLLCWSSYQSVSLAREPKWAAGLSVARIASRGESKKLCVVTYQHKLHCSFTVGLTEYASDRYSRWDSLSIDEGIQCGRLANGTTLCSGKWFTNEQPYTVFHQGDRWKKFTTTSFTICGIEFDDSISCWAPFKTPPNENPRYTLDVRYAHWSGVAVGLWEVCGYAISLRKSVCWNIHSGTIAVADASEMFVPLNSWRCSFSPSEKYSLPADSVISLVPVAGADVQTSISEVVPLNVDFMVPGITSVVLVLHVGASVTYYSRLETEDRQGEVLGTLFPIPVSGPLLSVAASDDSVCVITIAHELWCDGPASLGSQDAGPVTAVAVTKTHACAITTGYSKILCWGEISLPDLTTPVNASNYQYLQLSTSTNLTCAVSSMHFIHCWGTLATVAIPVEAFTGSGWVEVKLSDGLACGSHINGRLRCVNIDRQTNEVTRTQGEGSKLVHQCRGSFQQSKSL